MKKIPVILAVLSCLVGSVRAQTANSAASVSNKILNISAGTQADDTDASPPVWRKIFQTTDRRGNTIYETQEIASVSPVHLPNFAGTQKSPLDDLLAWSGTGREIKVAATAVQAHFAFNFTNVSSSRVSILDVHPSCGCTTVQLPSLPWPIPAGGHGHFSAVVNFEGKSGTLFKTIRVSTDRGSKTLLLTIHIEPATARDMSAAARAQGLMVAKADRQAVFRGDCASCHRQPGDGKYGNALYDVDCGICHEGEHRATMVPDLRALKVPTSEAFWREWIIHGKPGSLMPAFSHNDGGPLTDEQIISLADYLKAAIPARKLFGSR
jgi:mono/diheme cytochrome c family protein